MTNQLEATSGTRSTFEKGQETEQVNYLSLQAHDLLKESSKERQTCNTECNRDTMNTSMEASHLTDRQKLIGNFLLNALEQGNQEQFNKLVGPGGSDVKAVLPALNSVLKKHGMSATFEEDDQTLNLKIYDNNDKSVIYQYQNSVFDVGVSNSQQSDFQKVQDRMSPLF